MLNIPFLTSKTILSFPRPGRLSDHINSRIRSLDIDQQTVEALLSQYGLKLSGRAKNLPNARRNTNLIIETNQGRKIFKQYRKDWKYSTIQFEHSILQELERVNFPAPRLVSMPEGQTWVSTDNQNFCMFDFIDGKNYSSSFLVRPHRVRMMGTSGRTLAALHKQLVGFQPKGQHHLGFTGYNQDRLRDIPWHARKIEELFSLSLQISEPEDRQYADWLVQNRQHLYQELFDLDKTLKNVQLPRIIIHGDYGLHNLIYSDLDHAVPVDYELARIEWRMSDLVSVISKFRYKDGSYDYESIIQFLHAYQHEFPIDDAEWQYFPLIWKYYKLMKGVQYWISYFETSGPVRKLRDSRKEIEYSNWAIENPQWLQKFRVVNQ